MNKLDVRITVELPNGKREQFGYAWPEHHLDGRTFAPLPRTREIEPWAMQEAMAQRDRRQRVAETIAAQIADAILTAAERQDTVRGYTRTELSGDAKRTE